MVKKVNCCYSSPVINSKDWFMNKIKYLSAIAIALLLLSSCRAMLVRTNTKTDVSFNKFKNTVVIANKDNYVKKNSGCTVVAFDPYICRENDSQIRTLDGSEVCFIQIKTEYDTPLKVGKGNHMWVLVDGNKIDLTCVNYTGEKRTSYYTSPGYYNAGTGVVTSGTTTATDVCYEEALFVTNIEQIKQMAEATTLTFEIETCTAKPIWGCFQEKNFLALRNFVDKVSGVNEGL